MVEMAMFNVQKAIHVTPKVGKPKLGFMSSVPRLTEF